MNESAIILNGNNLQKVSNFPRKYNKLANNPNIQIIEECKKEDLESRYEYWQTIYPKKIIDTTPDPDNPKMYLFINKKNGYTISSIYKSIEELKKHNVGNISFLDDYEPLKN